MHGDPLVELIEAVRASLGLRASNQSIPDHCLVDAFVERWPVLRSSQYACPAYSSMELL